MFSNRTATITVAVLALLIFGAGFVLGRYTKPADNLIAKLPVVPVEVEEPVADVPDEFYGGGRREDQPVERELRPLAPQAPRDTLVIEVPVEVVRYDSARGGIGVVSENPINVRQPLFGTSTVELTTFDTALDGFVTSTYRVPEPPFKYGLALDASVTPLDSTLAPRVGLEGYIGYRAVQPFARVEYDAIAGESVRAGVRIRIGR